jgi:outer membrane protein
MKGATFAGMMVLKETSASGWEGAKEAAPMQNPIIRTTRILGSLALLGAVAFASPAYAIEAGDVLVRVGGSLVDPDGSSGEVTGIPGSGVSVDDNARLSFTIGYMMTDNIAVEVLGALPFKHDIKGEGTLSGLDKIAQTKHLPPTVSLQYHFMPKASVRPYVGAGINYTVFFDEEVTSSALAGTDMSLDDSWGLAAQVGADVDIGPNWFVNADVRYIDIETTATLTGAVNATVDVQIDPWVYTLAVGRRF